MNKSPVNSRRSKTDRRIHDHPLPAFQEDRRRTPERRLPKVSYYEFDEYIQILPVATEDEGGYTHAHSA